MKHVFSILLMIFLFANCGAQTKTAPPKPVLITVPKNKSACGGSDFRFRKIDNWFNAKNKASITQYDFKNSKPLETVRHLYKMKNGILYFKENKIDSLQIFYRLDQETGFILNIVRGKPTGYIINANGNPKPSMYSVSYANDDLYYRFVEEKIFLPKGNGIFKNFYYGEWDASTQKFTREILQEEGEIKNFLKIGEWKYYNRDGRLENVKTYSLKDSVDVRFPHCIFNKIEPCY